MRALVTGGAGFIGSHLVEGLLNEGMDVRIYDNFSSGSYDNILSVKPHLDIVNGDIRDFDSLKKASKGIDKVFHLAALTSVAQSVEDPILNHDINTTGTLNVLWAALKTDVSRVVIASSCAVYGDIHRQNLKEFLLPRPKSPYAATKSIAEAYAETFFETYGLEAVCLRFFNVYGLRQRADSGYAAAIPRFIECYKNKARPQIYGDGLQSRDFIHVKDVARANIIAATSPNAPNYSRVFNIGTGKSISILDLLNTISKEAGYFIEPEFKEPRQGDIKNSCANITLAKEKLGFSSSIKLGEGIKELLNK